VLTPDKRNGPHASTGRRQPPQTTTVTVTPGGDVAASLRRRRDAAWRLPPLASGYRDPIDQLAGLAIPKRPQPCRGEYIGNGRWRPCCRKCAA
jgi:hypothetical protein